MQQRKNEQGFTLIELLIAIVVVGILTAVAIVGIGSLTNKGEAATCAASADAAKAAAIVHYANNSNAYPSDFRAMTNATPTPEWQLPSGVAAPAVGVVVLTLNNQTLTMSGGGATPNTFICS